MTAQPDPRAPLGAADLDAIEQRADTATPGPWFWNSYSGIFSTRCAVTGIRAPGCFRPDHDEEECTPVVAWVPTVAGDTATTQGAADAAFIEYVRTDVPALVAEVRRARAEVARLRAALEDAYDAMTRPNHPLNGPHPEWRRGPATVIERIRAALAGDGGPGAGCGAAGWDEVAGVAIDAPRDDRG